MNKLTGRRCHRFGLFGKLILRVEEQITCGNDDDTQPSMRNRTITRWRDAKAEDLDLHRPTNGT